VVPPGSNLNDEERAQLQQIHKRAEDMVRPNWLDPSTAPPRGLTVCTCEQDARYLDLIDKGIEDLKHIAMRQKEASGLLWSRLWLRKSASTYVLLSVTPGD
jgi:hypothetical protein